jgi:hypothetical protein
MIGTLIVCLGALVISIAAGALVGPVATHADRWSSGTPQRP